MILDESPPKLLKTGFIVISGTVYDMYLNVSLQSMPSFPIHSTTFKDCMFQLFHPNPSPGHPGITSWSLGMTQIKSFEMHLGWQILPPASLVAVELLNSPFHILAATPFWSFVGSHPLASREIHENQKLRRSKSIHLTLLKKSSGPVGRLPILQIQSICQCHSPSM